MATTISDAFVLEKYWEDVEPGVEVVEIRYACRLPGRNLQWSQGEETRVLVPERAGSNIRRCSIHLPCGLDGKPSYDLHYYFMIVRHGRQLTTPAVSERIVSAPIVFEDAEGMVSAVGVQWEVGETGATNYTLLESDTAVPSALGARRLQRSRLFKGRLWAPQGSIVDYAFHIETRRRDCPDTLVQLWDTNADLYRQLAMA